MSKKRQLPIDYLEGFIIIETMTGNQYPINTKGLTNEQAVCQASHDLKVPCRMVTKGEQA